MSRTISSPAPFRGLPSEEMEPYLPAMGFHRISVDMEDHLSDPTVHTVISRRVVRDDPEEKPQSTPTVVSKKEIRPVGEDRPKNLPIKRPPMSPAPATPVKTKTPAVEDRPKNLPANKPPVSPAPATPVKTKTPAVEDRPKNLPANKPPVSPALTTPVKTKAPADEDRPKNLPVNKPPVSPALTTPVKTKPPADEDRPKNLPVSSNPQGGAGSADLSAPQKPPAENPEPLSPLNPTPPVQIKPETSPQTGYPNPLIPLKTPATTENNDANTLPDPVVTPVPQVLPATQAAPPTSEIPAIEIKPVEVPGADNPGSLSAKPSVSNPPPISPFGGAGDRVPEPVLTYGAKQGRDSLSVQTENPESDFLTATRGKIFNDEQTSMDMRPDLLISIGNFFRDLVSAIFKPRDTGQSPEVNNFPAAFPGAEKPPVVSNPVESFRAGYISQRDLETALGREDWTMCCAATFIYAVQTKYPGLSREEIIEAAGKAAKTELADGSGPCVSDDGYVASIHQYSQALSRELGLKDYVDTPGVYPSIEAAKEAGVTMMKVELSGTANDTTQEHHIFRASDAEIDPYPGANATALWDRGSVHVENVMALGWYELP